jgi:UPF0716 protein FxsA
LTRALYAGETMILPLVLLFIVVPIAELAVIIQVGEAIGVWWTIALLIADSVLGSLLMRHQGRAAWRRFTTSLQSGRVPAREVLDGALVLFGGAMLLTPGFLSDILGALLLLPPTRAVIRGLLVRRYGKRLVVSMTSPRGQGPRGPGDIQGTAVDIEPDVLRAPRSNPTA